jgi:aspartate/methionine/tyrosine aminotransferase
VLSKAFGLAGLRIGWIACRDAALVQRLATVKDWLSICNAGPSEVLALAALRARRQLLQRNRGLVLENLALVDDFLLTHGEVLSWTRPRAGCIGALRIEVPEGATRWCSELLEQEGVLLAPGEYFELPASHVRIGFGRRGVAAALERTDAFLRRGRR